MNVQMNIPEFPRKGIDNGGGTCLGERNRDMYPQTFAASAICSWNHGFLFYFILSYFNICLKQVFSMVCVTTFKQFLNLSDHQNYPQRFLFNWSYLIENSSKLDQRFNPQCPYMKNAIIIPSTQGVKDKIKVLSVDCLTHSIRYPSLLFIFSKVQMLSSYKQVIFLAL